MASRIQATDLDFLKVGIVKDARLNPLTTSDRTTLGGTLTTAHKGVAVWDTDENIFYLWSGSSWVTGAAVQTGLTPKGSIAFNGSEPGSPVVGDLYVFTSAGTNTWEGSQAVQIGDQIWWDGTIWQLIQGNVIFATETVGGIAEIATSAETITGTDDTRMVTPAKLKAYLDNFKFPKTYFSSSITTVANTPLTINHSLGLQHRDAYTLSFKVGNSEYTVDTDSIDTNSCSVTTNTALTGTVTIVGY